MDPDGPWDDLPTAATVSGSRRLEVSLISPTRAAFRGKATAVVAPAHDGRLGILYGHAPMVILLGTGELVVHGDEERRFRVSRGFLQVVDNEVSVLAEQVETL